MKYRLYSFSQSGEIKGDIDPKSFVVKVEEFGVPQARHRMFILGVRDDIDIVPSILQKKKPPTVEQILSSMPKIRSGISRQKDSDDLWKEIITSANHADWLPAVNGNEKLTRKTILSAIREARSSEFQRSSRVYKAPRVMRS